MTYTAVKRHRARAVDDVERLVIDHLALVRRLAWHVTGRAAPRTEIEELIQAGMVALVEAARDFEDRGFEFATYASLRIKGAMFDHLRRTSGQSRNAAGSRRAIEAARRAIEAAQPESARSVQLAERLGVSIDEFYRMEADAVRGTSHSLDEVYSDSDSVFRDPARTADDGIDVERSEARLAEALGGLDQRSQLVLQLYFFEEMNLEEIGCILEVGAARVCQIKKAALAKLRDSDALPAPI